MVQMQGIQSIPFRSGGLLRPLHVASIASDHMLLEIVPYNENIY